MIHIINGRSNSWPLANAICSSSQNSTGFSASLLIANLNACFWTLCLAVALMLSGITRSIPCNSARKSRILLAAIIRAKSTSCSWIARATAMACSATVILRKRVKSTRRAWLLLGPIPPSIAMASLCGLASIGSIDRRYQFGT